MGTVVQALSQSVSMSQEVCSSYSLDTGIELQGVQQRYKLAKPKSVASLTLVQTNWGTDPILPTKVNVLLTEGQTIQLEVIWNMSASNVFS